MSLFSCRNGFNISWDHVCDGVNQCNDGSDEIQCQCQGDFYTCIQGNNVSCRLGCESDFKYVTCLTYRNKRACEQYHKRSMFLILSMYTTFYFRLRSFLENISTVSHIGVQLTIADSSTSSHFDALKYSALLAASILLVVSIVSIFIYLIRKKSPLNLLSCNSSFINGKQCCLSNSTESNVLPASIILQSTSSQLPRYSPFITDSNLRSNHNNIPPPSYRYSLATSDEFYEPPPYPGDTPMNHSHEIYYESIKSPSSSTLFINQSSLTSSKINYNSTNTTKQGSISQNHNTSCITGRMHCV
ncbi:unnamed protein product [Didymodactylos carnosus]|uniref:Uncharacterized protein n=1 Tax=Didymodactylos carnosus TaxID=1234261 RepID=A0A814ZC43_9BILA|nr:unnamed protein product [Didymodactylos carnosus]CAF4003800.1 unnamed protein product [Didymodactylos carnosus]